MEAGVIPLSVPCIRGNAWKYVKDCLDTEWVSSAGEYVDRFEQEFARYVGATWAVACVNGTSALHVALRLAGVVAGDAVLVPTVTFIAPVNAVRYLGAEPVLFDCDEYLQHRRSERSWRSWKPSARLVPRVCSREHRAGASPRSFPCTYSATP